MKVTVTPLLYITTFLILQFHPINADENKSNGEDESSNEEVLQQTIVDGAIGEHEQTEGEWRPVQVTNSSVSQQLIPILRTTPIPPHSQNICLQPKEIGKCKLYLPRYFFNSVTAQCELFAYGGCGRNKNNFKSLFACESECSAHLASSQQESEVSLLLPEDSSVEPEVCELPPTSPGPGCKAYLPRWTYDKTERRCIQFIYSGCGATANMYLRKYDCQQKCGNYQPKKADGPTKNVTNVVRFSSPLSGVGRARICSQLLDTGTCFDMVKRFYFNPESNRCLSFTFNGCGGNDNNFQSGDDCLRTCGGSTPAENVACTHVSCPMNLYSHYTALGCEPIYDGNACCPTRYDCQRKAINQTVTFDPLAEPVDATGPDSIQTPKCHYKGKLYSIGQEVTEASSTSSCRAACTCTLFGTKGRINCANIECPETLGVRPPGKENCSLLYRRGECCAYDYNCIKNETTLENTDATWIQGLERQRPEVEVVEPFRCIYEGKEYVNGEKIEAREDTCRSCICQIGFNGTLTAEVCEPVDCGIEIYYADQLEKGCVPVYYQDAENRIKCCPIGWECPDDDFHTTPSTRPVVSTTNPAGRRTTPTVRPISVSRSAIASDLDDGFVTTDACALPIDVGSCKASRARFAYNQITKLCEPFTFGGCGGNKNNFVALQDCIRVCGKSMPPSPRRGTPATPLSRSSTATVPPTTHELSEIDICTQPPKLGPCRGYFRRFYYSPELNECRSFVYSGCGGGKNNFFTMESCTAFCQNKIPTEFLGNDDDVVQEGISEVYQSGRNSTFNRRNHRLNTTVLNITNSHRSAQSSRHITLEDLCSLPQARGPCAGIIRRIYYDKTSRTCKQFVYGGCGGNQNNFLEIGECEMRCLPKRVETEGSQSQLTLTPKWRTALGIVPQIPERTTRQDPLDFFGRCQLPKEVGSCRAWIPSYYFDVQSETCKPFNYGGCFGNSNRFSTLIECESICKALQRETITPQIQNSRYLPDFQAPAAENNNIQEQEVCSLPVTSGDCRSNTLRFHWQAELKQCLPFVYSGCKGNRNNFLSEADCLSACAQEPPIEALEGVLTCSFGNETFSIGSVLRSTTGASSCGRPICQCITPPALTCIQRQCPLPPFLIQVQQPLTKRVQDEQAVGRCPIIKCSPGCRSKFGSNGCPVCECGGNSKIRPFTVPPIPSQRNQSQPCRMFKCSPHCRASVDPITGCPNCDCSHNSEQVQIQESFLPR